MISKDCSSKHRSGNKRDTYSHADGHGQADDRHDGHSPHGGSCCKGEKHTKKKAECGKERRAENSHKDGSEVVSGIEVLHEISHCKTEKQDPRHREHGAHSFEHLIYHFIHRKQLLGYTQNTYREHSKNTAPEEALHTGALRGVSLASDGEYGKNRGNKHPHWQQHI